MEKFKDKGFAKKSVDILQKYANAFKDKNVTKVKAELPKNATPISELDDGHIAKEYIKNRKIPNEYWGDLFYTPNFKNWVNVNFIPDKFKITESSIPDERIIIPYRTSGGELYAVQGRYAGSSSYHIRYISCKKDTTKELIYGLNTVNTKKKVYITEGPFDSMFLKNSIAVGGSSLSKLLKYKDLDVVFIFDNQPRNREIISIMEKIINENKKIVIFPKTIIQKDINEMVLSGITNIQSLIDENTFQGLESQLKFSEWKSV